jgi:hypothetical protein
MRLVPVPSEQKKVQIKEIQAKHARLHEQTPTYSSAKRWLRQLCFGQNIFESGIHTGEPPDSLINFKIATELTILPFLNVRTLSSTLKIPR